MLRRRHQDAQAPTGHHLDDGQQDRTLEIKQSTPQVPGYDRGVDSTFIPTGPPPPRKNGNRDREEMRQARGMLEIYDRELRRRTGELRHNHQHIGYLQHESQRSKDIIDSLQNELNKVHQQLDDANNIISCLQNELNNVHQQLEDFLRSSRERTFRCSSFF